MATLLELAQKRFKDELGDFTEAERLLLINAPKGEVVDMRTRFDPLLVPKNVSDHLITMLPRTLKNTLDDLVDTDSTMLSDWLEENDPQNANMWASNRTIHAELIKWLLLDKDAIEFLPHHGFVIIGVRIPDELELSFSSIDYPINIRQSSIGNINLYEAKTKRLSFTASDITSFNAEDISVDGSIFFNEATFHESFRLINASIKGSLSCNFANFFTKKTTSFSASAASIGRDAFFDNIESYGEFRLTGINIKGQLSSNNSIYHNPGKKAFIASGAIVIGGAYFKNVLSNGEFILAATNISTQLSCRGATFINERGNSFVADRCLIKGNAYFDYVYSLGLFRLAGAMIEGQFILQRSNFYNLNVVPPVAISLQTTKIHDTLMANQINNIAGIFDLTGAKVRNLIDDERSWPRKGMLLLDGFEYESLAGASPKSTKQRLRWLELMPTESQNVKPEYRTKLFFPQPYEQLAKIFKQMGMRSGWRNILFIKAIRYREFIDSSWGSRIFSKFLRSFVGHLYKPWYALIWLFVIGLLIFFGANSADIMQPSEAKVYLLNGQEVSHDYKDWPSRYPVFYSLVYSLDTLIPFLNLHQEDFWLPDTTRPMGIIVNIYLWIHIACGWLFSTLSAAAFSGILRKDE